MASKHTKIKRAIQEFKLFLDYYRDDYTNAEKNIKPDQGWGIKYFESDIYDLLSNLYGNLYEGLHPKLFEDNPATDKDILDSFKNILDFLEKSQGLFQDILNKSGEKVLSPPESIVYDLILKAIYKLKEVISLAEDDLANPTIKTDNSDSGAENTKYNSLIGIVTATLEEFTAVENLLEDKVRIAYDPNDSNTYYEGFFIKDGKRVKVILTQTHHQGLPAASTTTTKLILKYKPKILFMVGHLAGNKKRKDIQKLGDIVIGEESVDYQQNEIIQKKGEELVIKEEDRKRAINADSWLISLLETFGKKQDVLDGIKKRYDNEAIFKGLLEVHRGKIVSGSALLRAADRYEEIINQNKGLMGLDMETHGFYYSCVETLLENKLHFASVKSISDFGEQGNSYPDEIKQPSIRQKYASFTSANFIFEFIMTDKDILAMVNIGSK